MDQKDLISKLIEASEIVSKGRIGKASYIHLTHNYIEKMAQEKGVGFEEMCIIIQEELNPKNEKI
jgi:hypothetical protein